MKNSTLKKCLLLWRRIGVCYTQHKLYVTQNVVKLMKVNFADVCINTGFITSNVQKVKLKGSSKFKLIVLC